MHEIVVLSGKGGTGKTSIAASLAFLAGTDLVLADCDVDAANMHLLMEPDYQNAEDFFYGATARIDEVICSNCGLCRQICRFAAITVHNGIYTVHTPDCEGCIIHIQ